jgi:hypothetical protein
MRNALLLAIKHSEVVVPYRRFGTTYQFHVKCSLDFDPLKWDRYVAPNVGKELPLHAQ